MAGFGGSVKLTGESEYQRALKSITQNLTMLSSEMKVVTSLYGKNDTSTESLAKKNEILKKKLDEQNKSLAEAKKMLDQAKNSTDANEETVMKWQVAVNKAQAEVNKTSKEIKDNTETIKNNEKALDKAENELSDFKKGEDEAGQSAIKMGDLIKANIISEAIIGGIKALGSAVVGLSKQAFAMGKQAIESFAEYEQLIGGVETLFKESSSKVENYANNAYKTAGLSANEYMSTVTSFSASLLQSLNGDTAKSAEVADMAITDMSDNANKMGTDIASIQNAYQGFAKQNYTMLDNLKLGYGGTKTEMERLLKDATAISGVEYDISNLSDVYNAIHVIQGELGITGTTAKEASTTIQGSLSSMKSAWQNLLTGVADENANFGELINNFVDSILTVGDNLLPRIQTTIQGIGQLVSGLLTQLVPEIVNIIPPLIESTLPTLITAVQTAITSIVSVLPQITQSVNVLIPQILSSLIGMLPQILDVGVQIILSLISGLGSSLPTLIPVVIDAILTIVDNLISNIDLLVDAGIQLIIGLAEGLINAIPVIIEKIPIIIENLISAIYRNQTKLLKAGMDLIIQLGIGLIKAIPNIIANIPKIISSIVSGIGQGLKDMRSIGKDLLLGLGQGLWDGLKAIGDSIKQIGNTVVGWFKNIFKINSPSKVFADEIGTNLALGIGEGFENTMSSVTDQMVNSVPNNFDINTNATTSEINNTSNFNNMVEAFKQALKEVNIILDDEVAGRFVTDTVERVVYN